MGKDRASFQAEQARTFLNRASGVGWGPWTRDKDDGRRRYDAVNAAYDSLAQDVESALTAYGVRYVGLRAGQAAPESLSNDRWARLQEGPVWQIWSASIATALSLGVLPIRLATWWLVNPEHDFRLYTNRGEHRSPQPGQKRLDWAVSMALRGTAG